MRLSLYILADWLKEYSPVCSITDGNRTIRNVRIFSDEHHFMSSNVYVGRTGGNSGRVICIHENDYLILNTDDENQVMNDIMDAFDYYNDWSDRLNRDLRTLSLQEILDASISIVDSTLMLADASYYILAHAETVDGNLDDDAYQAVRSHGIMGIEHILNIERDTQIREYRRRSYIQYTGGFSLNPSVRNLFTAGSHWGWLISVSNAQTQGKMDIQDELGDILEQWMQLNQENQKKWEQSGVFLSILDGTYAGKDSVYYQLRLLGWQQYDEKWVYTFTEPERSLALIHKVEQLSSGVQALIYDEHLLALFHGTPAEHQRFEHHLRGLLEQSGCRCGISPCFRDIFMLKEQFRLAQAATAYSGDILISFEKIALTHGLSLLKQQGGAWLPHPALRLLKKYDEENHTSFYETFFEYLRWERSYAKTAQVMELHRNTLLYRITRILEITELNLDDPEVRLHLLVSFAIEHLQDVTVLGSG